MNNDATTDPDRAERDAGAAIGSLDLSAHVPTKSGEPRLEIQQFRDPATSTVREIGESGDTFR